MCSSNNILYVYFLHFHFRYYRLHKAKENYRIFTNQQHRGDSVDGSLSDSIAGINPAAMAYDNPVFMDRSEQTSGIGNSDESEVNPPPYSNKREERDTSNEETTGNHSLNSFPLKNGSFFSRSSRSESTSSDPKSFEPLPSVLEGAARNNTNDDYKSSFDRPNNDTHNENISENRSINDILNF
jgi:hypothetical protein